MSDYFHFTLDFLLRRDAPQALHNAVKALANRELPAQKDLDQLPGIVADYLTTPNAPKGIDGDGFTYRYARSGVQYREENPQDGTHWIHIEQSFHDDEYFNGGMFFPFWLMQFSAQDGYLGIYTVGYAELPTILVKDGEEIIEINLALNPSDAYGIRAQGTPVDRDVPARVLNNNRMNLQELLDGLGGAFSQE